MVDVINNFISLSDYSDHSMIKSFNNSDRRLMFNRDNTLKGAIPNSAGIYKFYDKDRRLLYVGSAKHLRHRVQSYRQVDDPTAHPTKTALRSKIVYYDYKAMPIQAARANDRKLKVKAKYNYL